MLACRIGRLGPSQTISRQNNENAISQGIWPTVNFVPKKLLHAEMLLFPVVINTGGLCPLRLHRIFTPHMFH